MSDRVRHILSLSGGKDSSALAIYMRDRIPDMEYVFCDTKKELAETYEYLDKIEAYLGKPVVRLCDERGFDHWLDVFGGFLPSSQMRWCTKMLKIKPFEKYVGDDEVLMYVGIRADENRQAYVSTKPNIKPMYPFKDDGIAHDDVVRILQETIGLPAYYNWRTRSGCYFCFFQRKNEWVGLLENHPDLYQMAMQYEKSDGAGGGYTWGQNESLKELSEPARVSKIKSSAANAGSSSSQQDRQRSLFDIIETDSNDDAGCDFCHI
jgi:3'-phosphoadenosine 5'-phosphosulfate sulfotransferase (PAPS reductase)/FAD synthetase